MNIIKTKSFKLAVNSKGDKNSEKLAIVLPGRLDTKDYECFNSHLELLASNGLFAMCFDPPGTWDSPGEIELFTTTNYVKAVNELIEHFGSKPTFLMGHSRGGTISILAGASNPKVVGFAPIMATYDKPEPPDIEILQRRFQINYRDMPPGNSKTKEQKKFKLPITYFQDLQKYYTADILKQCTKPKLLFYGTEDEFTEPKLAKAVFSATLEPKMIHKLNTDHDYRYHPKIIGEVNKIVGQFLGTYLVPVL